MKNLFVLLMALSGSAAFGAVDGTLELTGSVSLVNEIIVTPNANATALDIVGGEIDKLVATVTENSNNPLGYKIFVRSANASKLVNTAISTEKTGFSVSYNGGPDKTLTTTDQQVKNVASLAKLVSRESNVTVKVNGKADAVAGTYSDTITISIAAN